MVEKMGRNMLALVVTVLSSLAILASSPIIDYYYSVYAQSPGDTTVPITVSIPINIQAQNAQICASILSSGSQTCQQIILNPIQTSYQPVNIDLVQPVPTINSPSSLQQSPVQQQQPPQPLTTQEMTVSLPINIQAQNAQLCISIASSGSQTCQQIVISPSQTTYQPVNVDLTQPIPTITTSQLQQQSIQQSQQAGPLNSLSISTNLVDIDNTDASLPINVIAPTNIQAQNAQHCISIASSGSQTCQQIVISPSQTTYQPVSVDFTQPTPTFESPTDSIPTAPGPATEDTMIPTPTTSPTPTGQTPPTPESQLQEQEQQPSQEPQPGQEPTTTPDDTNTLEQNPTEEGDTNDQDETSTEGPDSTGDGEGGQEGQ